MDKFCGSYSFLLIKMMKDVGLYEAAIFAELLNRHEIFFQEKRLEDSWFYMTADELEDRTGIKKKKQDSCIDTLINLGFIQKKVEGYPLRRWIKFNEMKCRELGLNDFKK